MGKAKLFSDHTKKKLKIITQMRQNTVLNVLTSILGLWLSRIHYT